MDEQIEVLKKTYYKERSNTVFAGTVFVFLIIFFVSAFFALSVIFPDSDVGQKSSAQNKYALPCINENTHAIDSTSIFIRVLNGSGKSGLGSAVSNALAVRGFQTTTASNAPKLTHDTQIRYGENAIKQAYTISGNFASSTMIMDDRTDGLIDVVIGGSFLDLIDQSLVTTASSSDILPIPNNCQSPDKIKKVRAIAHDAKQFPAYKDDTESDDDNVSQDSAS